MPSYQMEPRISPDAPRETYTITISRHGHDATLKKSIVVIPHADDDEQYYVAVLPEGVPTRDMHLLQAPVAFAETPLAAIVELLYEMYASD